MSSLINIPFNHEPIDTVQKFNTDYTVPIGKYARVVINVSCSAYVSHTDNPNVRIKTLDNGTVNESIEIWANSSDVISSVRTPANTNTESPLTAKGTSTVSIKLNGVIFVSLASTALSTSTNTGGLPYFTQISGIVNVGMHAEEFNNV